MTRKSASGSNLSRRNILKHFTTGGVVIGGISSVQPAAAREDRAWYVPNDYNDGGTDEFDELGLSFSLEIDYQTSKNIPCNAALNHNKDYTVFFLHANRPDDWVGPGPYIGGELHVCSDKSDKFRYFDDYKFGKTIEICKVDWVHHGRTELVTIRPVR